jgi:uncharacterized cupin superfamily protein
MANGLAVVDSAKLAKLFAAAEAYREDGVDALQHYASMKKRPSAFSDVGVWRCGPCSFPPSTQAEAELCLVLSGRLRLTDSESGAVRDLARGDVFFVPKGWRGRWDVLEETTKLFATFKTPGSRL